MVNIIAEKFGKRAHTQRQTQTHWKPFDLVSRKLVCLLRFFTLRLISSLENHH